MLNELRNGTLTDHIYTREELEDTDFAMGNHMGEEGDNNELYKRTDRSDPSYKSEP